jgi:hypothetical protein
MVNLVHGVNDQRAPFWVIERRWYYPLFSHLGTSALIEEEYETQKESEPENPHTDKASTGRRAVGTVPVSPANCAPLYGTGEVASIS